jgi:outer membrane protein
MLMQQGRGTSSAIYEASLRDLVQVLVSVATNLDVGQTVLMHGLMQVKLIRPALLILVSPTIECERDMNKTLLQASIIAAFLSTSSAWAQQTDGNWMVRVRALHLEPANKSDAGNGQSGITSTVLPSDAISVNNKWIPEVDVSYFFTKNIAAELVLTVPQKQDVTITKGPLAGTKAGTFKHLPPSLLLQYHFMPDATFRPYVGAGVNYTRISSVHLDGLNAVTGTSSDLEHSSWGAALQAGFDVKLDAHSYINFDVKKVYIKADLKVGGNTVSTVNVDPILWGVGYGYRF